MNPSLFSSQILLLQSFFFFFFIIFFTPSTQSISYSDHCNSHVPEAIPTEEVFTMYPSLEPVTSHYTGGQTILGQNSTQPSILSVATRTLYKTNIIDTYKIQARLRFVSSNIYYEEYNFTSYGSRSNYSRMTRRNHRPLVFLLDGFWSVSTTKLCMVGSARWYSKEGNRIQLDAVLKLNFARHVTLVTSLVSGVLESLGSSDDSSYFEPIMIIGFPSVAPSKYNYTQLEYTKNCSSTRNCTPFGQDRGFLPSFVSLYTIQCSWSDKKLRFLVEFQDRRYMRYDQSFDPNITLIGEGTWNGTKNKLCIVACRILNQTDGAHVGDCSTRLTLWFPAVRSIKNTNTVEGQISTTKTVDDIGYFETIKFRSFSHSVENYGSKYEFTQYEKVRQFCPLKKHKRKGDGNPEGYYPDLTFDMSVKHKNMASTGFAIPIFVGDHFYGSYRMMYSNFSWLPHAMAPAAGGTTTSHNGLLNISYEISFTPYIGSSLNLSSTLNGKVDISAEGVYDTETRQICMIGCRNLFGDNPKNESFDCEILVKFKIPEKNQEKGSIITGSITSLREKQDVLHFDSMDVSSLTYTEYAALKLIWRMNLEMIMFLVSDTLACLFIARQLFHVKKQPETICFLSVLMMVILTLGHMVPLVLNFEAIFLNGRNRNDILLGTSGGWLEVNEVIVRLVKMVAFVLQFRLLQMTWTAKLDNGNRNSPWAAEIRTLIVTLLIYVLGGSAALLKNLKNDDHTIWGDLRLYAGLTLDGFLIPQLILNIFEISKGNALSHLFYIGTTFVRLMPHAYDLYRGSKNISHQFNWFYIYANPRADFYSPSWDIMIACGGITFAVIVFLQQRFGGRFMFPKRFRESKEYEMVPAATSDQT